MESKMNSRAFSILFSCLLATTFFHELNAKVVATSAGLRTLARQKRHAKASPLTLSCPTKNLLVIKNATAPVALVIDTHVKSFVLLNGTSGSGICMKENKTQGTHIPGGLWNATNTTLEDFLKSIKGNLGGLPKFPGSEKFDLKTASEGILGEATSIVTSLVSTLGSELLAIPTLALELIISLVGSLLKLLTGVLKGLLDLLVGVVIELAVDIFGLLNILEALASVLVGGLLKVLELGVELPLDLIIGAADGLMALVNLILHLGPSIGSTELPKLLESPEKCFQLIAKLGGNGSGGLNGLFLVISKLLGLKSGSVEVPEFINILKQFAAEASHNTTVNPREELKKELPLVLDACDKVGATDVLGGLVSNVEGLLNKSLTVAGVNISGIIEILLDGLMLIVSGLALIVEVLLAIPILVLDIVLSLPYLLLILISSLESALGVQHLLDLGVDLGREGGSGKLLSGAVSEVGGLLGSLLTGNLYGVLADLPVIGNIVQALNAAVSNATGGKISLETLLNLSKLVKDLTTGILQLVSGVTTGLEPSVVEKAKKVMDTCNKPASYVHATINQCM